MFIDMTIEQLQKENTYLRAIVAKIQCPYGHRNSDGICSLGYPGCSCADDVFIAEEQCIRDLVTELKKHKTALEIAVKQLEHLASLHEQNGGCDDALAEIRKALNPAG